MRKLIYATLTAIFFLSAASDGIAQTIINGKVLSADGSTIVEAEISTTVPDIQDIFADKRIKAEVAEDGTFQLQFDQPGIYLLSIKGVFHQTMNVPVLIYDQPSMEMNILMLPKPYKSGRHFENEGYLQWIRVMGNFNQYDYRTGEQFTLNEDGSISATVPVTSDTMRIQVSGISYGQGSGAITPADKFELLPDNSFVSVLYKNLPEDSLEIRYKPNESIPYRRVVIDGRSSNSLPIDGFITFRNNIDRYWVEPLITMQAIPFRYRIVDSSFSEGILPSDQISFQKSEGESYFEKNWGRSIDKITGALKNSSLHEQQKNSLLIAYVGVVHRANMRRNYFFRGRQNEKPPELEYNPVIIDRIFEEIEPGYIVWAWRNQIPMFILESLDFDDRSVAYFTDLVLNHSSDDLAERVSHAIVEGTAQNYTSVEDLPVYQAILQRFGEGSVLRRAELMFKQQNEGE